MTDEYLKWLRRTTRDREIPAVSRTIALILWWQMRHY